MRFGIPYLSKPIRVRKRGLRQALRRSYVDRIKKHLDASGQITENDINWMSFNTVHYSDYGFAIGAKGGQWFHVSWVKERNWLGGIKHLSDVRLKPIDDQRAQYWMDLTRNMRFAQ